MTTRPLVALIALALWPAIAACGGDAAGSVGTAVPARSTPLATPTATASTTTAAASTTTGDDSGAVAPLTEPGPTTTARPPATSAGPPPTPTGPPIVTRPADIGVLAPQDVVAPVTVEIPALGVVGPVLPVGVNAEDQLDVPPDARSLVWYRHGPSPGADGSAVIAGHLNWKGVTGIFSDLALLPVGEVVTVVYGDGSRRDFTVTNVEMVLKPAVSVNGTFARGGQSVLRLVTCGGEFDDSVSSYKSNVVVTAVPR